MTFWLILAGMAIGAWAMLNIVGGEHSRRLREIERAAKARHAAEAARANGGDAVAS